MATMAYVNVYADSSGTLLGILKKATAAQIKLSRQAFSDCSKYCKKDTGRLMASGRVNPLDGVMTWDTEYARIAYYTGNPDRSKNPHASLMWAHKAAAMCGARWKALVERELL